MAELLHLRRALKTLRDQGDGRTNGGERDPDRAGGGSNGTQRTRQERGGLTQAGE